MTEVETQIQFEGIDNPLEAIGILEAAKLMMLRGEGDAENFTGPSGAKGNTDSTARII